LRRNIPELDGVRAIAILAVIVFHAGSAESGAALSYASGLVAFGWCGVDLFFVLSGFLITGILIDTKETPKALRNFYARRVLRIFPLYYLTLVMYFHVLPGAAHLLSRFQEFRPTEEAWYWLYICNWSPSFGAGHALLSHLWSLSIEEQFYMFWPLLVLSVNRRTLALVCASIIVLAPCLRTLLLFTLNEAGPVLYRNTLCRIDTLAFGAVCAMLVRDPGHLRAALRVRPVLLVAGFAAVGVSLAICGPDQYLRPMNVIGFSALALLFAYVILWAQEGGPGLRAALRFGPLRSIGKYSYAMYIFHVPVVALLRRIFHLTRIHNPVVLGALLVVEMMAAVAVSYAGGLISWRIFENPFLKLKSRFEYREKSTEPAVTVA
jgi:peptidoglycan/LPS O-acetylase OafA/YrhL